MAVEIERLVATLEANFSKYDRALNKALGNTNRQFTAIEKRGKQMEKRLSNIGGGISKAFVGAFAGAVSVRGAQQLIDSATKIDNALKVAGLSGEELDRVYKKLYASAQKNAAPIESLVQLYGRASLVQKELGITTEELLGFTDKVALALRVSGQSAAESSGALLQLSQALGSGVVRAEEFNSILEGALPIAQAAAEGLKEAGGSVATLRQLVVDGKVSSEAFFRAFEAGSATLEQKVEGSVLTIDQRFTKFQTTLIDTARDFNKNADAGKLVGKELDGLTKGIKELADEFIRLGAWVQPVTQYLSDLDDAASNLARTVGSFLGLPKIGAALGVDTINDQTWNFEQTWKDIDKTTGKATELQAAMAKALGGGGSGEVKPVSLSDFAAPDSKKKGSKRTPEDRWASEVQQWQQRAAALRLDTELVGKSTYEIERRRAALDLEQTLEKQGLELTPQRQKQIQTLSEAYAAQVVQLEKVNEAQQRVDDAARESFEAVKTGWMDAITGAESFKDALAGVIKRLAEIAASRAFDALFMPSVGGASGGALGGIFGSIGKVLGFAGGGYTGNGGRNQPAGVVHRGEYVMPKSTVDRVGVGALSAIDRGALPGYAQGGLVGAGKGGSGGGGGSVSVVQNITIQGPIDASMRGYFDVALADMKNKAQTGAVIAIREGLRRNPRFLNA